ncbi:MAG: tRNA (guanosine(37)-N1)-methyltransferase TrmD [Clostridia bacterium]|nr:tRNA (guanosine(37)-N1)-methyltransferase TrmD [Clostridia bacterium]
MKFDVLTLFPEMFTPLTASIIGRASKNNYIKINITNIRDFSKDKHKKVDDTPYGGGAGMVMRADVVYDAYKSVATKESKVIYLTPQGKTLDQEKVKNLSKEKHIVLLCGHYEGIDQRVIDEIAPEEISIGDYVLTGGELPAMVLIDSVSRYVEGVLNKDSIQEESFSTGLLEYPQYTRPEIFYNRQVPEILLSGHHEKIEDWRKKKSLEITYNKRPDLLEKLTLTNEEKQYIENLKENKN